MVEFASSWADAEAEAEARLNGMRFGTAGFAALDARAALDWLVHAAW